MESIIFEILATIFGLVQGILILMNKRINWIFYLAQIICLVIFSSINHLWGDVGINLLFIGYGIFGYILWGKSENKITKELSRNEKIISFIILLMFPVLWIWLRHTNDPLPFTDSITTIGAILATYLMVKRNLNAWIVWFIVDILYIIQYFLLPDKAIYLMGLNIIWTGIAICSYINWNNIIKSQKYKIFVGGKYNVMHKDVTPENAPEILKDDLRAKLVGIDNFLYPSQAIIKGKFNDYIYNGGFYYEAGDGDQISIVDNELREIDESDIIFFDFTKAGIVATISELYYALYKNKKIIIFKNPNITTYEITSEYWFLFESISRHKNYENVKFYEATNDDTIIKNIINLK